MIKFSKNFLILVLLQQLLLFICRINSQNTLVLNGLIYDNTPRLNIDFEPPGSGGVVTGLVLNNLGADSLPVYCCGNTQTATIHSASTFKSWFNSVPGINIPIPLNIILTQSPVNPNIYSYTNDTFFPIDGQGFDNKAIYPNEQVYRDGSGKAHNFHFCFQAHTQFQYKVGDVFNFAGDDDVWVFINNKLVVDLGNIHTKASASVNLNTLGLTPGNNYNFDFFYCERHTTESHIKIETSLKFVCPVFDECGVCQGDGSSCCTTNNCNNKPENVLNCIQAYCSNNVCIKPPPTCVTADSCMVGVCVPGTGCTTQPRTCTKENHCTVDFCNSTSNACQHDEIPNCVDCLNTGCITTDLCNVQACSIDGNSCITVPKVCDDGDYCTTDTCNNGVCVFTRIPNCLSCPGIGCMQPDDLCNQLVCSNDGLSCVAAPFFCDDKQYCTTDSCFQSQCSHVPILNCKECEKIGCTTTDFCNVQDCGADGASCISVPKNCDNGNPCDISDCVSPLGTCTNVPKDCNDNIDCTFDSCSGGTCSNTQINNCTECLDIGCITTDACFPQICLNGLSCTNDTKICDDNDGCTTDTCISPSGSCDFTPVTDICENCNGAACITTDLCFPMVCANDGTQNCVMTEKNCDDFNGCTIDSCLSPTGTCQYVLISLDCVNCNGTGCLTDNLCSPAQCDVTGKACTNPAKSCEDGNFCTSNSCNSTDGSCLSTPIDNCVPCLSIGCVTIEPCKPLICNDNGDGCITTDKNCEDGDFCTINSCNALDGTCSNIIIPMCLNCTGIGCATTDLCLPKICSPDGNSCIEVPLDCNDNDPCTDDLCFEGQCNNTPRPNCIPCGINACITNSSDFCNPVICDVLTSQCTDFIRDCDDSDPCTIDSCSLVGCVNEGITNCVGCSPSFACITEDLCRVQECSSLTTCTTVDVDCNDNDNCTIDTCLTGKQCLNSVIPGCVGITPFTLGTTLPITISATTSTTSSTTSSTVSSITSSKISTISSKISTISSTTGLGEIPTTSSKISTISSTTGHYTESATIGNPHLCLRKKCNKGFKCHVIYGHAECLPSNYKCMDCVDLQCHKQGLSCTMIENFQYSPNKCSKHDLSTCCKFSPTCKPLENIKLI